MKWSTTYQSIKTTSFGSRTVSNRLWYTQRFFIISKIHRPSLLALLPNGHVSISKILLFIIIFDLLSWPGWYWLLVNWLLVLVVFKFATCWNIILDCSGHAWPVQRLSSLATHPCTPWCALWIPLSMAFRKLRGTMMRSHLNKRFSYNPISSRMVKTI